MYQDHLTVMLKALTLKRAETVVFTLLDIFKTFNAPSVFQSDNYREFRNSIITSLQKMWKECKIVNGKNCHC